MPATPIAPRASRTSSSLNGLMMAMMNFITDPRYVPDELRPESADASGVPTGARAGLDGAQRGGPARHRPNLEHVAYFLGSSSVTRTGRWSEAAAASALWCTAAWRKAHSGEWTM